MITEDMASAIVSSEDVRFFEENGYLHLKNVIGAGEIAALRAFEEAVSGAAHAGIPSTHYVYATDPVTTQRTLYRINAASLRGGAFLEVCGNPALLGIGEAIFGPDFVPLGVNLVIKRPGYGVSIPWHRDPSGFRLQPGINAGIYFDDATPDNGMLYVVPGTHKADCRIDLQAQIEEHGFHIPGSIPVPARAGDVVVHSENLLHGSRVSRGQSTRRVLYYCFRSVEEQLSRGGKFTPTWVQFMLRQAAHAIRVRAASEVGRGETPFQWKTSPEYKVSLRPDEYVELWIDG